MRLLDSIPKNNIDFNRPFTLDQYNEMLDRFDLEKDKLSIELLQNKTKGLITRKYIILGGGVYKCTITDKSIILDCGGSKYDRIKTAYQEINYGKYLLKKGLNRFIGLFGGNINWN